MLLGQIKLDGKPQTVIYGIKFLLSIAGSDLDLIYEQAEWPI